VQEKSDSELGHTIAQIHPPTHLVTRCALSYGHELLRHGVLRRSISRSSAGPARQVKTGICHGRFLATTAHHCYCPDFGRRQDVQISEERFVVSRVNPAESIASMNAWLRRYTRQHVPTLDYLHQKHRREFALRVEENQIFPVNFQARRNHMLNGEARYL
jgi:hypothetical protein